jgi:hypothetical protein
MYSEAKRLQTQMKMIFEGIQKIQTQKEPYRPEPVVSSVGEVQQQPSQRQKKRIKCVKIIFISVKGKEITTILYIKTI